MKKHFHFYSILLIVLFLQSCAPTDTVTPDSGDVRDKYVGNWLFIENTSKSSLSSSFTVVISLDPSNSSQVLLSNFGNTGPGYKPAFGVATTGNITVPTQTLATDWVVDGSGDIRTSGIMAWTYSITAGGDKTTYTATATKQ